ncbi:MAG: iron ABC transporter permease [Corticimicrobacter sp.]|uniref:FecCD family ABC transporter permease n=1 Tax=Corticimicrobacter sp. TaxID=2678536 RepID=UPI0032DB5D25
MTMHTDSSLGRSQASGRHTYGRRVHFKVGVLLALLVALCLSLVADIGYGPTQLSLSEVLQAIVSPDGVERTVRVVVWDMRLPMALMAVLCGAALALAGAQMQTILDNPMASPFTLGISAAASFGASLGIAAGISLVPFVTAQVVPVNAFVMAMLSAGVIHLLSVRRHVTRETIILFGLAMVFIFNALLAIVQFFSSDQAVAAVVFWSLGSLTKSTWPKLGIVLLSLAIAVPFFACHAWKLTALRLGDQRAASLGVKVARLRLYVLVMVSLLAACSVAAIGTIGFIGLIAPHLARLTVGEDQRFFMPVAMLCGGLILSLSSLVSRMILPGAIFPIGVITTLIGIPFFIALIMDRKRQAW